MQGTSANHVAYPRAGLYYWGNLHTSHFAVPKGTAVWLATIVRCLWHPLCKRPNGIIFANYPYLLPLALKPNNQTMPVLRRPERPTII